MDDNSPATSPLASEAEDARLMQEALAVLTNAEQEEEDAVQQTQAVLPTAPASALAPPPTPSVPAPVVTPVPAPSPHTLAQSTTVKRSREEYETDLQDLETDKTNVIQLEHTLYEARYKLKVKTEAFHAKHYPEGIEAVPPSAKKASKRRKKGPTMSASGSGDSLADGSLPTKTLTRGWNNYQVFRKLCKELLPGSRTVRRPFNRALWEHQKQQMEVFFSRHQVSTTACKAMADMNAYHEHITTTVRAAMEAEMPFYVEMIRVYDADTDDVENLSSLSTMCALQMLAKTWSTDKYAPSQTILMAVWTAFQGLLDLECKAAGIPALFSETIPEGSLTPPLTEARLKHEVAPKLAASMPYLVTLFQSYTQAMNTAEVDAIVQKARKAQADGNVGAGQQ